MIISGLKILYSWASDNLYKFPIVRNFETPISGLAESELPQVGKSATASAGKGRLRQMVLGMFCCAVLRRQPGECHFDGTHIHVLLPNPRWQTPQPPGPRLPVCRATSLPGTAGSPRTAPSSYPINVNAATLERYIVLPGIGTQIRRPV